MPSLRNMLVRLLTAPLTDAKVTAPLLIAVLYYPEKLKSILPAALQPWISNPLFARTLMTFLGIEILSKANTRFSQLAVNNFKSVKFIPSQEIVLITGGSSGIGALMAKEFAEKGAKVIIIDLNPPAKTSSANVFYYHSDVTSPSKIAATAAEIRRDHGDPTVLINNAGVGSSCSILDGSERSIQKTFEVNTISHFWMAREFLPSMIEKNHGHVVTIASMASYVVLSQNVDYSCTKASAGAFHEGLHSELRNRYNAPNVRTTLVNPGWIKTPLTEPLYTNPDWKGHAMEPEEVSSAVVSQVLSGKSGHLILPKGSDFISSIRGWPSWLQYGLRNSISKELDVLTFTKEDKTEHFKEAE